MENRTDTRKEKKCFKCGSTHVAKVVPASALCVPEIRKDVEEGRAVANCCCAGTAGSGDVWGRVVRHR